MRGLIALLRDASWLTSQRIWRVSIILTVIFPAALLVMFWFHTLDKPPILINQPIGDDFSVFWSAELLAADGHAATAYDANGLLRYANQNVSPFDQFRWYGYPPIAQVLFLPFALLPYISGYIVWILAGITACAFVFSRFMDWPRAIMASLAPPMMLFNALSGQNGAFTAALMAGAIVLLETSPVGAGILFGLLSYKPQLGILIPFALMAGGKWRTFFAAVATVVILAAVSVWLLHWDTWQAYFKMMPMGRHVIEEGRFPDPDPLSALYPPIWKRTPTIAALFRLAGASVTVAYAAQAIGAMASLFAVIFAWRGNASAHVKGAVLILATFLATPYAWDYDMVMLTFAIVWLWQDGMRRGFLPYEKTVLAATMAFTLFYNGFAKETHIQAVPLFIGLALIFALRRAKAPMERPESLSLPA